MSAMQDIEIYLRQADPDAVQRWLSKRFDGVSLQSLPNDGGLRGELSLNGSRIPVSLFFRSAGKQFSTLWFNSPNVPWADDLACAREAHAELGIEVRCMAEGWSEGMEEDEGLWWVIRDGEERQLRWR